jgi:uncharacterized protein
VACNDQGGTGVFATEEKNKNNRKTQGPFGFAQGRPFGFAQGRLFDSGFPRWTARGSPPSIRPLDLEDDAVFQKCCRFEAARLRGCAAISRDFLHQSSRESRCAEEVIRLKSKLLFQENQLKTFALVFDKDDDVVPLLLQFAEENNLHGARLSGIGAFQRVRLGYFDRDARKYQPISIDEQVELLSFIGNFARKDGKAKLHAHVIVGKRDGTAHGGHLLEGHVWPTMEIMVVETPAYLQRTLDEGTGLALLDLAA